MSKTCVCAVSTGPSEAGPRMLAGHNLSLSVFEDGYSVPTGFLLHISGCRYSVRTLTIFLVMSTLLLGSRPADADGMYAPEDSGDDMSVSDIRSPDQHGLLIDRGEEQELVVRVRVTSTPRQLAWVLPLPSAPLTAPLELVEGDRLFEYLYHLSAPRWTEAEDVVSGAMPSCGDHGADGDIDSAEGVTLLGAKMIGELEVTTLEASSADELVVWLGSNGYRVPEDLAQVAQPYVDRKWVFVAMKLDSPIQPEGDVRLQVLHFRWQGKSPVFPIEMTRYNASEHGTKVTIFVVGRHRMEVPGMETRAALVIHAMDTGSEYSWEMHQEDLTIYAGTPEAGILDSIAGMWLTRLEGTYSEADMNGDLYPVRTQSDVEYFDARTYANVEGGHRLFSGLVALLAVIAVFISILSVAGGTGAGGKTRKRVVGFVVFLALLCVCISEGHARNQDLRVPERILLGSTAEVPKAGTVRISWTEVVLLSVSVAAMDDLYLTVAPTALFGFGKTGGSVVVMASYRVVDLGPLDISVGGGAIEPVSFVDPVLGIPLPFAELAITSFLPHLRLNLCARYFSVPDRTREEGVSKTHGIDDILLHAGIEWEIHPSIRVFVEPTMILPLEQVDRLTSSDGDGEPGWNFSFDYPDRSILLGYGVRALHGRWSAEAAFVKGEWSTSLAEITEALGFPWFAVSVVLP